MFKSLCCVVLLLGVLAFTSGSKPAGASVPAPLTSPTIVAKVALLNQTASIPSTTILTSPTRGLYRVNAYMIQTDIVQGSNATWNLQFNWTDDAGAESDNSLLSVGVNGNPPWGSVGVLPGSASIVELAAGQPLTYSTFASDGGGGAYALYLNVERLE
jgi:hypothetical protein